MQKIAKNSPSAHHHTTSSVSIFATKARINNRNKLVKQQYLISPVCLHNLVNFGSLAAEICWRVWGIPANFTRFRVFAVLLHGTLVVGVSQTLRRWTEGATYMRRVAITLGIGPHSSWCCLSDPIRSPETAILSPPQSIFAPPLHSVKNCLHLDTYSFVFVNLWHFKLFVSPSCSYIAWSAVDCYFEQLFLLCDTMPVRYILWPCLSHLLSVTSWSSAKVVRCRVMQTTWCDSPGT